MTGFASTVLYMYRRQQNWLSKTSDKKVKHKNKIIVVCFGLWRHMFLHFISPVVLVLVKRYFHVVAFYFITFL